MMEWTPPACLAQRRVACRIGPVRWTQPAGPGCFIGGGDFSAFPKRRQVISRQPSGSGPELLIHRQARADAVRDRAIAYGHRLLSSWKTFFLMQTQERPCAPCRETAGFRWRKWLAGSARPPRHAGGARSQKELEEQGYIMRHAATVDRRKVELDVCCHASIPLAQHAQGVVANVEAAMTMRPEVVDCYGTEGTSGYRVKIVAAGMDACHDFLHNVLLARRCGAGQEHYRARGQEQYGTAVPRFGLWPVMDRSGTRRMTGSGGALPCHDSKRRFYCLCLICSDGPWLRGPAWPNGSRNSAVY